MLVRVMTLLFALGAMLTPLAIATAQDGDQPAHQLVLPFTARDVAPSSARPTPVPTVVVPPPPPPGPGYCLPSGAGVPFPPNTVFGLLTIGGEPAPALTLVTLTFDGSPGPSAYTSAAGGFRVDYAGGGAGHEPRCINEVGSVMGLLVDGSHQSFGIAVGDPDAGLVLRYDVAIP